MLTLAGVIEHLEQFAPPRLAADWDNVGLLLGDRTAPVARIMTCLTVTPESAGEAVRRKRRSDRHSPPDPVQGGQSG